MLRAQQMQSLPEFFKDIPDPRRAQGQRHRLATVLAIAAGAILCGMRGYLAISDWANSLSQKARERFGCRRQNRRYIVPSLSIIRDVLIRVDPVLLDRACSAGTTPMLKTIPVWELMARPCAMPSTIKAIKLIS